MSDIAQKNITYRPLLFGLITASSLYLFSYAALAKPKSSKSPKLKSSVCSDVESCVDVVSKLTGNFYSSTEKLEGKAWQSSGFRVTAENADSYLSEVLHENGYTRVLIGENRYKIIPARDIRYTSTKMIDGNKNSVPLNDDYMMVFYELKDRDMTTELIRSFRPFMSRYGRLIDLKHQGRIIMQDTGRNINRLIKLIKEVDRVPTRDELVQREERREREFELEKLRAKNCPLPPKK